MTGAMSAASMPMGAIAMSMGAIAGMSDGLGAGEPMAKATSGPSAAATPIGEADVSSLATDVLAAAASSVAAAAPVSRHIPVSIGAALAQCVSLVDLTSAALDMCSSVLTVMSMEPITGPVTTQSHGDSCDIIW